MFYIHIAPTALQGKRKFVTLEGLKKQRTTRRSTLEKSATDQPGAETEQGNSEQVLPKVKYIDISNYYSKNFFCVV